MFEVVWDSSNPDVATVDENGVVTILTVGETIITASITLDYTYTKECYICVTEKEQK